MKIWHMSGAGNDFMVLDIRGTQPDLREMAIRLCRLGGTDGFMAVDHSQIADFRLHYYNSDGSRGELCGNGSRCICRFAFENGIAGEYMTFETDAGLVQGHYLGGNQVRVQLPPPGRVTLDTMAGVDFVEVGCPHAVKEYAGDLRADAPQLKEEMRAMRHHPLFPKGANVDYFRWLDDSTVQILTFERGVEDFTLACGTGTAALATTLWTRGLVPQGLLTVENPGGVLKVSLSGTEGQVRQLLLEGPADVVAIRQLPDDLEWEKHL